MQIVGASIDQLLDEFWNIRSGGPLGGQVTNLLLAGNLAGQEEPEEAFVKLIYTQSATFRERKYLRVGVPIRRELWEAALDTPGSSFL